MNEILASESTPSFSEPERRALQSLLTSLKRIEENVPEHEQTLALSFLRERAELNGLQNIVKKVGIGSSDSLLVIIRKVEGALVQPEPKRSDIQEELRLLESFAEAKASEQEDIMHTGNRITEYERELEALSEVGRSSLWQRLFSKDETGSDFDPNQEKREELENKIMRAQTELAGRMQKTENQALYFQNLLQTWQQQLGEPVGLIKDWQKLVAEVKVAAEKLKKELQEEKKPLQKQNLVL